MVIKRVKLTGFKRLSLNNIYILEYTPTMSNLIMGTNGSGKTSLIREMSKMIGNKKDYNEDGSLEITVEKDYNTYELKSKNGKHSFIKNGEELNAGHTGKVQEKLISLEFKLTNNIRNIINGDSLFTTMSPIERKEWFTMVSPVSFDYLVSVYNKARVRVRDLEGSLKLQNKKIIDIEDIIKESDYKKLKEDSAELGKYITGLQEIRNVTDDIELPSLSSLTTLSRQIINFKNETYTLEPYLIQNKIDYLNTLIEDSLEKLSTMEDGISEIDIPDITELENKVTILKKKDFIKFNYEDVYSKLKSNNLKEMVSKYNDSKLDITLDELNKVTSTNEKTLNSLNNNKTRLVSLETERDILIEAKKESSIECPSCKVSFKPNFNSVRLEEVISEITYISKVVTKQQKIYDDTTETINSVQEFNIVKNDIFIYLSNNDIVLKLLDGNAVYNLVTLSVLAKELLELPKLENSLKEALIKKEESEKTSIEQQESLKQNLIKERDKLNMLYKRRERHLKHLKRNTRIKSSLERLNSLKSVFRSELIEAKKSVELYTRNLDNSLVMDLINSITEYKNVIDVELREIDFNKLSLSNLKIEVSDLKDKIQAGKLIVNGLSPNKGLIAKTLMGFIGNFINKMNKVIKDIWSYDMEIITPEFNDRGDLSYRFPVMVNGELESADGDVKDTSTGMTDIINLAFVLVSKEYLGIENYPLYLDEFASSFDTEHRRSAIDLINTLMEDKQVFMISHYTDVLYSIGDLDISILSTDNIETTNLNKYNENMMIL